jgi:hypothetical protein
MEYYEMWLLMGLEGGHLLGGMEEQLAKCYKLEE